MEQEGIDLFYPGESLFFAAAHPSAFECKNLDSPPAMLQTSMDFRPFLRREKWIIGPLPEDMPMPKGFLFCRKKHVTRRLSRDRRPRTVRIFRIR